MKLFKFENGWELTVAEEAWGLLPFKVLLERDKTENKEIAFKEMLYIFYFSDIRSNYLAVDEEDRSEPIKREVGMAEEWIHDEAIQNAIDFYNSFDTPLEVLYKQALVATQAVGRYLENAEALLAERDKSGKPVNDISKITGAITKVPKLMADLKTAYKELVKEKEDNENKSKGSKKFNTFERGL